MDLEDDPDERKFFDCGKEVKPGYDANKVTEVKFKCAGDAKKDFEAVNAEIMKTLAAGGEVLVHCHASISRSAVFIIAYLMKHHKMSAVDAAKYMKTKWDATWPCDRFSYQLIEYEKELAKPLRGPSASMTSKVIMVLVVVASVLMLPQEHCEDSLLTDWSAPPPWPVFITLNALAGLMRGAADALMPPPIAMLDMSSAYHKTVLSYWAMKTEVPDLLADKGALSAMDVAKFIGQDPPRVERLLYACAAFGVFKLGKASADGVARFVNTPMSAVLRESHPNSMRGFVGHNFEDCYLAWGRLPEAMSKGKTVGWDLAHPEYPAPSGLWKYYEANPASEAQFAKAMTALDGMGAAAMVEDGPWGRFKRVIDVGGGKGHFLHRIMAKFPGTEGVLLDRPPVIELAKKAWAKGGPFGAGCEASRVSFAPGSFFDESAIPKAKDGDAYYVRNILHDWPLAECIQILKNLRKAMGGKNTTLLIGECALPEHDVVGVPPIMYAIDIQMMAAFGDAQERTPTQWSELLESTGFKLVRLHPTRSLVHWVEAIPV